MKREMRSPRLVNHERDPVSVAQVGKTYGVGPSTVRRLARQGRLQPVRLVPGGRPALPGARSSCGSWWLRDLVCDRCNYLAPSLRSVITSSHQASRWPCSLMGSYTETFTDHVSYVSIVWVGALAVLLLQLRRAIRIPTTPPVE